MRRFTRTRPVLCFWLIAVALEIILIPIFLLTGADGSVSEGLDRAGLDFNTDLVTFGVVTAAYLPALLGGLLALLQVASPDLAVLGVVAAGLGRSELRAVSRRFRFWAPELGWRRGSVIWLELIAVFCAASAATALIDWVVFAPAGWTWEFPQTALDVPTLVALPLALVTTMFLDAGALFEENGWRGFALPRLQARMTPLRASLVIGLMWTAWHVPVKFGLALDYGAGGFLAIFAVLLVKFTAISVLITRYWNRLGGATIAAIAMHGLSNDSMRLGGLVLDDSLGGQLLSEVTLTIPLVLLAAFAAWRMRSPLLVRIDRGASRVGA